MADFTPLTSKVHTKPFLVLDIESKDGPSQKKGFTRPFMVGLYDGVSYTPLFDTTKGYWKERWYYEGGCVDRAMRMILTRKYRGWHIYAHNAGRFDYLFLLPWLMRVGQDYGLQFCIIPVASSIQVLDIWMPHASDQAFKKHNVWRFLDSYRLMPMSLAKAAKAFGMEGKLATDLDMPEDDPRWVPYNKQDCVLLYDVLKRYHHYIETVLGGEVGITAPSTSVKLLRRKYMKRAVPRSEDTHEFVRNGYFGGRVEVFRREGSGLYYFDLNSSYPAAMKQAMPAGEAKFWETKPPASMIQNSIGFVQADVFVPENLKIPPLPIRGDGNHGPKGKLVFPVGKLSGTWEWSELEFALSMGCTIENWKNSVWYEPVYLYREFVDDLYKYRDKSRDGYDSGLAEVVKLMLNSCYGKAGQKTLRKKLYRWDDPKLPANATPCAPDPDCPIWLAEEECDACYIMPQLAARVTAVARVRLLKGMLEVMQKGGEMYYVDTDSLICDVPIETSTALGAFKDEYPDQSGHIHGSFLCPKVYILTGSGEFEKIKIKGVDQENHTRAGFEKLSRGETIFMRRLEKVGMLARVGFMRGPEMRTVPKQFHPVDGKRIMNSDGTTTPYTVFMW
jgi:hypothetical protein